MRILVIDGQGGRLGKQLVESLRRAFSAAEITAIGTNSTAAATMLKAGADQAATGENPVIVACRKADFIVGPVGIVIADSLLGEVTPKMAVAVARSSAVRVLIPMNRCDNLIAGVGAEPVGELIADAVEKIRIAMTGC
ncbi:MAG: DUF3842 family protein [Emergencia sp.]|nr:DUF3842 family protein [Emergencia sp.]